MKPLKIVAFALALPLAAACSDPASEIQEESPGLLARAALSADSARALARSAVSGGTIVKGEIEEEGGLLVYSFDLSVEGRAGVQEVLVDAATGRIVSVEHESPADEAAEAAEDAEDAGKGGA